MRLIPAHAGKTLSRVNSSFAMRAHPRSRGENVAAASRPNDVPGSSPLTRGKPSVPPVMWYTERLIPAHAGKTGQPRGRACASAAHPRSRGENDAVSSSQWTVGGSSPLTRGKRLSAVWAVRLSGLIPAHAGKTVVYCLPASAVAAHPRSRGENCRASWSTSSRRGSSPLTRGKRMLPSWKGPEDRLIPAHAGKTRLPWDRRLRVPAHPRSRGENPRRKRAKPRETGSSPLTRGKRRRQVGAGFRRRLIPAHAGKTARTARAGLPRRAHPRSRGENVGALRRGRHLDGSSPLTRGKRLAESSVVLEERLIPAHAGKTFVANDVHFGVPAHPRSRGENTS